MGKLIRFPLARARRLRPQAARFAAFTELELVERAQLKLFGACSAGALLVTLTLQLAAR